jgi:hypothetical protein
MMTQIVQKWMIEPILEAVQALQPIYQLQKENRQLHFRGHRQFHPV